MSPLEHTPVLLLALIIDAVIGDPGWIYRRIPHPVVAMGAAIDWSDRNLNRQRFSALARQCLGVFSILGVLALSAGVGWAIHEGVSRVPYSIFLEGLIASLFIAQNSLYRHVSAVGQGFASERPGAAREAVARIVGRDPASLDEAGTCRAAIESLAENFSDGVVAPAFWYLLLGLPGLLAYKALNTADSMIGHKSERHRAFGWAAARLDDIANYVPARLSTLAITVAAVAMPSASPRAAIASSLRDAANHRSVNAGWPEAAMAGALGLRLAGPRRYAGVEVEDAWMGDGRAEAQAADIRRALRLFVGACLTVLTVVIVLGVI